MDAESSTELAKRAAQLEGILANAVDAIITIDQVGNIHSVNPATERVFGYTPEEVIGRNVNMLMPSPFKEEHDGYLSEYMRTGLRKIIGIGREVVGQRKDGSSFPMHLAVSEIESDGQRLFTGVVRDISDLKQAQDELSALNEQLEQRVQQRTHELQEAQAELIRKEKFAALGQVAGGIAHEIRNPLNAIKTSAYYLLNARSPSTEKVSEHLERIDRQVTMADSAITALTDFAKLPEPDRQVVNVEQMLRGIVGITGLPSNVDVEVDVQQGTGDLWVDANQIPIVFRNLVRNARDAMPEGGKIQIHAAPQGQRVCISVTDTGTGISKDELEKILEPLYTTKARGMGLGLSISRAIVEKHDGTLQVSSALGTGSTFSVSLPSASQQRKEAE